MNVVTLDGETKKWSLVGNIVSNCAGNKSSLHIRARELITKIFPTLQILEEVTIPIRRSESLYLDFYLPLKKYCIEVHGEQHYKMTAFYHNNMMGFLKSKKRDSDKKEWCLINNIKYIELPYNEDNKEWEERILNA
jgi:hypothetical protein